MLSGSNKPMVASKCSRSARRALTSRSRLSRIPVNSNRFSRNDEITELSLIAITYFKRLFAGWQSNRSGAAHEPSADGSCYIRPEKTVQVDPFQPLRHNHRLLTRPVSPRRRRVALHALENARFSPSRQNQTAVSRLNSLSASQIAPVLRGFPGEARP